MLPEVRPGCGVRGLGVVRSIQFVLPQPLPRYSRVFDGMADKNHRPFTASIDIGIALAFNSILCYYVYILAIPLCHYTVLY